MTALVVGVLLYVCVCAGMFHFQRSLLYFPQPSSLGDEDHTVLVHDGDVKVVASFRPGITTSTAIVYFGGNAEDVTSSIGVLRAAFPNDALYLMHYRSYGGSAGLPTEASLLADALALFDTANKDHAHVQLVGRSLGTGLATRVASMRATSRLVLITPYDSVARIAAQRYWFVPVRWLIRDRFESWRYAPHVTAPTTILAATDDVVVPLANTRRLLATFHAGVATMTVFDHADHESITSQPTFVALLGGAARLNPESR